MLNFNLILIKKMTLLIFIWFISIDTKSEIYQWVDENGHTHFGDRAPQTSTVKEISKQVNHINISSDLSSPEMILRHQQAIDA
tara:strand:- start:49965 stop:50213 length:249 start_codon:yes stop_codon:yes gene_type:complete